MCCAYEIDEEKRVVRFINTQTGLIQYPHGLPFDFFEHEKHNLPFRREIAKLNAGGKDYESTYNTAWLVARDELVERGLIPE